MDVDQPQRTKSSAHVDFITIINHICDHKSLIQHLQYVASGPLAYIWFMTDARQSDVTIKSMFGVTDSFFDSF